MPFCVSLSNIARVSGVSVTVICSPASRSRRAACFSALVIGILFYFNNFQNLWAAHDDFAIVGSDSVAVRGKD